MSDKHVKSVRDKMRDRERTGLRKYGVILDALEWIPLSEYGSRLGPGSGIYIIRSQGSGRVYIGSTKWFGQRMNEHRSSLLLRKHPNKKLLDVFGKHGLENMHIAILERCEERIIDRETHWIVFFDSYVNGLNQTRSGESGSLARAAWVTFAASGKPSKIN